MNRVARLTWAGVGIYWIVLFTLTHIPAQRMPHTRINDKVAHLVAYGLLAGLLHLSFWIGRVPLWRAVMLVVMICAAYGAVDELLQSFVHRSCDFADWRADMAGCLAATALVAPLRVFVRDALR